MKRFKSRHILILANQDDLCSHDELSCDVTILVFWRGYGAECVGESETDTLTSGSILGQRLPVCVPCGGVEEFGTLDDDQMRRCVDTPRQSGSRHQHLQRTVESSK